MRSEPIFRRLAAQLSDVKFSGSLMDSEHVAVRTILNLGRGVRVYKLKGLRWAVNYYSAQAQRTWARPLSVEVACRLADMITLRNAPNRIRLAHTLTDADFNISEERARRDLGHEAGIVSLLVQMETDLPDKPARLGRPKGLKNRTLRDEVLHIFDTIMFRLNDVLAAQSTADTKLSELRRVLHLIQTRNPSPTLAGPGWLPTEQPYSPPPGPGWPLPPGPTCPMTPVPSSPTLAPTIFCANNLDEVSGCR